MTEKATMQETVANEEKQIVNFSLNFFSLKAQHVLELKGTVEDIALVAGQFASGLDCTIDSENKRIELSRVQKKTNQLVENVAFFVSQYKELAPQVNKLNTFIKKLDDNEIFYVFPYVSLSQIDGIRINNELHSDNDPSIDLEKSNNRVNELFGDLLENYKMVARSTDKKNSVGEGLVNKRVCRFCKKSKKKGARFSSQAHAISEALGNKTIILNEECDECNSKFEKNIEKDAITYLGIYKTFFGIKNKYNKVPKIKGKNFEYGKAEDGSIYLKYHKKESEKIDSPEYIFPLEFYEKITKQNIYKALCKFALGVIDSEDIPKFDQTMKWLNSECGDIKLPKIAILHDYSFFHEHPQMNVYLRESSETHIPFAVGEFQFTCFKFVFVIPLFEGSKNDFVSEEEYDTFFKSFKHFSSVSGWKFEDFSDSENRELVYNVRFAKSNS